MKSKIPKELKSLLLKRKNAGEKLLILDSQVETMLEKLNLIGIEYTTLLNDYGCMLSTEPQNYYEITVDYIEKQLNKKE